MSFFGLFGSFGFFGFSISQPNERDKPNKPNKQDEPVSAVPRIPTAAASELKDADPAADPLALTRASPVHGTRRLSKEICNRLLVYAAFFFTRTSAR